MTGLKQPKNEEKRERECKGLKIKREFDLHQKKKKPKSERQKKAKMSVKTEEV